MKKGLLLLLIIMTVFASAQDQPEKALKDTKKGCVVFYRYTFAEDSVSWSGSCKDGMADGHGALTGFTAGKATSHYTGFMQRGRFHGKGEFTYGGDKVLTGNFSAGEILELDEPYLNLLQKHPAGKAGSTDFYVGDHNSREYYYHALVPPGEISGALVLLPGTWQTTEYLLSSTKELCQGAVDKKLVVIVPSLNQQLALNDTILGFLNNIFTDAINRFGIPQGKVVMGGYSMGGLFSLRYAEMAVAETGRTVLKPAAVFSCDGPCDLTSLYNNFRRKLGKFPGAGEPLYGMRIMELACGGTPEEQPGKYEYYSCYSHGKEAGGNARFLKNVPVRIYADVDPNWWMEFRAVDMYDLNALDQSAMILLLREMGNSRADFINSPGKGRRLEGTRHPHSWNIVDGKECMEWISKCLENAGVK